MRKRLEILFVLMLFSATAMLAQMTTSGINGMVTAGGDKAIGATVTAVHEPSGTTYNTVVNESGRYSINGMRVGGPKELFVSDDRKTVHMVTSGDYPPEPYNPIELE